jgi:hypothetical protein
MKHKHAIVALVAVLAAAAVAAGALAASGALTPQQESNAIVNDAAERLGVEPAQLSNALKAALKARVDAAVQAGRLTEAQGTELKQRIDSGEVPLVGFGPGGRHGHGFGGPLGGPHHEAELAAAADYLGMTQAELQTALVSGKTLAQVAADQNKPVDGLVDAIVAANKKELDQAVADGRLTAAQRDQIVAGLEAHVRAEVNGEHPGPPGGRGFFGPDDDSGSGSGSDSDAGFVPGSLT